MDTIEKSLEIEARVLSKYLIGAVPPVEIIQRYAAANSQLLVAPSSNADQRLLTIAVRYPLLLGPLDVAIAFRRFPCSLKNKLLIMAAILEASPQFVDRFLPAVVSRWRLGLGLLGLGTHAGLRLLLGLPLLMCIRSRQ